MGCNLRDLSNPTKIDLSDLVGKRVGIDSFLVAFQFLTSIRDRSETGDGCAPLWTRLAWCGCEKTGGAGFLSAQGGSRFIKLLGV